MKQTARTNPPSTGYQRPAERKFYVWRDRHIRWGRIFAESHGRETSPWRWLCTLCDPPVSGYRTQKGAWEKIMTVSMPNHFRARKYHHEHVARTHGR